MNPRYIKDKLRELDIEISRPWEMERRLIVLREFRKRFQREMNQNYPDRFERPEGDLSITSDYPKISQLSKDMASDIDRLSAESAYEFIKGELDKREKRLTHPNICQRFNYALGICYRLCGRVPSLR